MVAVSTAAMWGFEDSDSDETREPAMPPGASEEPSENSQVPSVLDIATRDDDPEGDDYDIRPGTVMADTLTGTPLNEFLNGLEGNDTISASDGDDVARGGEGDDIVSGDDGDDTLRGDSGSDTVLGGEGQDDVFGHEGDDALDGGDGDDSIVGGEGQDTLTGGAGNDALHGYLGDDDLNGGEGADTLFGGAGQDSITGIAPAGVSAEDDQDYLNGGAGDDEIMIGAGDIATGGSGADVFNVANWGSDTPLSQIMDFSPAEDSLIVLYEDTDGPVPLVTIEQDEEQSDLHRILLNGQIIAEVSSDAALSLDHITLMSSDGA